METLLYTPESIDEKRMLRGQARSAAGNAILHCLMDISGGFTSENLQQMQDNLGAFSALLLPPEYADKMEIGFSSDMFQGTSQVRGMLRDVVGVYNQAIAGGLNPAQLEHKLEQTAANEEREPSEAERIALGHYATIWQSEEAGHKKMAQEMVS